MNRIYFFFIYTILLVLTLPSLFPSLRLLFFAPFLILVLYHKSKITCLWVALFCGLIVDLLSTQTRLGTYALNYCLTTWILDLQKRHFFEDSLTTLPIMTALFAIVSTLIQLGLLYTFGQPISLSWVWISSNLFWLPFRDALYAGIAFTLPSLFFPKLPKRQTILFSPKGRMP